MAAKPASKPPARAPAAPPQQQGRSLTDEIERLAKMKQDGLLTAEEFAQAKAKLLGLPSADPTPAAKPAAEPKSGGGPPPARPQPAPPVAKPTAVAAASPTPKPAAATKPKAIAVVKAAPLTVASPTVDEMKVGSAPSGGSVKQLASAVSGVVARHAIAGKPPPGSFIPVARAPREEPTPVEDEPPVAAPSIPVAAVTHTPKPPSGVQMGARPVPNPNAKAAAVPTLSQIIPQGTVPKQTAILKIYSRTEKTHWTLNIDYTSTVSDVIGKICNRIGSAPETLAMFEREGTDPSSMPSPFQERRLQSGDRVLPICQEWTKTGAKKHMCVGKLGPGEIASPTLTPSPGRGKENGIAKLPVRLKPFNTEEPISAGGQRRVTAKLVKCDDCTGFGSVTCNKCFGEGKAKEYGVTGLTGCARCNASGRMICPKCKGTTYVTSSAVPTTPRGDSSRKRTNTDALSKMLDTLDMVAASSEARKAFEAPKPPPGAVALPTTATAKTPTVTKPARALPTAAKPAAVSTEKPAARPPPARPQPAPPLTTSTYGAPTGLSGNNPASTAAVAKPAAKPAAVAEVKKPLTTSGSGSPGNSWKERDLATAKEAEKKEEQRRKDEERRKEEERRREEERKRKAAEEERRLAEEAAAAAAAPAEDMPVYPLSKARVKANWTPDPSQLKSGIVFLALQVGQELLVTEKHESGWWAGLLDEQEGVFPSGFVEEIELYELPGSEEDEEVIDIAAEDEQQAPQSELRESLNLSLNGMGIEQLQALLDEARDFGETEVAAMIEQRISELEGSLM